MHPCNAATLLDDTYCNFEACRHCIHAENQRDVDELSTGTPVRPS